MKAHQYMELAVNAYDSFPVEDKLMIRNKYNNAMMIDLGILQMVSSKSDLEILFDDEEET